MKSEAYQYITEMNLNDPILKESIKKIEKELGLNLPSSYREFLMFSNGAEGCIGKNLYLVLWKGDDLYELNEAYGVEEFAEGLLIIGSNGANEAYAFDKKNDMCIVKVPFIGMSREDIEFIGEDFIDLLKSLYKL